MLMGSETEFGLLDGWSLNAAKTIQKRVETCHPHIPATRKGVFLQNGSRVYVDQEAQNEYGTPEVEDPLLLVRHELAGRALMQEAAAAGGRVLLCSNLDYASRHSWGTHENYECRAAFEPPALDLMLTHLATRIVFCGAGGPHPEQPGMQIVMSPRATVTGSAYAAQGTLSKAMIFRKPDQYGAGHRLHVFCGESLLCPRASWLKYGTTALVAQCLDAGLLEAERLVVQDPLLTLHRLNDDLHFEERFLLRSGTRLTGLQIQRRIADGVAAHRGSLPSWADDLLDAWHRILDLLAARDHRLPGMIDWLLYWRLWHTLALERGFRPDDLRQLQNDIALGVADKPAWRIERYQQLCTAARELYVRLHALDDSSPLTAAAAAGWLEPPLAGLDEAVVLRAKETAPEGRAGNRARLIGMLCGKGSLYASWDTVVDRGRSRRTDIPREPGWSGPVRWEAEQVYTPGRTLTRASLAQLLGKMAAHRAPDVFDPCFRAGDYRDGLRLVDGPHAGTSPTRDHSSVILCSARMGRVTEARQALEPRAPAREVPFIALATKLFCDVNYGLVPPLQACAALIEEGERLLPGFGDENREPEYWRAVFNQCRGWVWLHQGRYREAIGVLKTAIALLEQPWRPRMLGRTRCFLAEAMRRKGSPTSARRQLALPGRIYLTQGLLGDAADHLLPVRAKLDGRGVAERVLQAAEALNRRRGHDLALARTLCLSARITKVPSAEAELHRLAGEVEALRDCPLMRRILDNWNAWVEGERRGDEDEYWGL
jgi:hypothetical protein